MSSWRIPSVVLLLACLAPGAARARTALAPKEAVERALQRNPSLAASLAERRSAAWRVVGEDAAFAPVLRLDAGLSHAEQPVVGADGTTNAGLDSLALGATLSKKLRLGTDLALSAAYSRRWQEDVGGGFLAVGPVYDTSVRLELTQPVLRGAGGAVTEAALRAARVQETESARAVERAASELVRDVLVAWWELRYADESLRIEEEALALAEHQLAAARRRVELGAEAPVELLSFETRVAERQEGVATAARTRRERALALGALLGDAETEIETAAPGAEAVEQPDPAAVRRQAVAIAPAVREAETAVELARLQAETADDPYRARLDVQGYAEVGRPSTAFVGFGDDADLAWTAGVNLIFELPLTGRRREAAQQQARLAVRAAEHRLAQARLTAEQGAAEQLARIESARTRLDLARRTVEVAEAQLRAEQRRYEIGTGTSIRVLEAEEAVRAARLRLARAEADLHAAGVAVDHLTGALVDRWVPADLGAGEG